MTCSVGQAFNGFDGLIKKNQLSKFCNMPEEGSFPRSFSLYPPKENILYLTLRERKRLRQTTWTKALQEVAALAFPLAYYPGATWWHC